MLETLATLATATGTAPLSPSPGLTPVVAPGDLGAWLHTLDPFLWRISGDFGIRWYGLSYLLGMALGYVVLAWLCARRLVPIPRERLIDVFLFMVVGVFVGGRLGYVVFYQPDLLWTFGPGAPWWGVLMVNEGGMASHGGLLGVIGAALWASRGFKNDDGSRVPGPSPMSTLDAAALVTPIGLGLGRLANFVNAELLGRIVAQPGQPAPWWAVRFPQEITAGHGDVALDPAQQIRLDRLLAENAVEPLEPISDTVGRITRRLAAGDTDLAERITPLLSARVPSQLIQAFAEGVVLFFVLWVVARLPRKPGVISSVFLLTYGGLRVITEIWRLPDAHLIQAGTDRLIGLSRGQLLSIAMVLAGAAMLWFFQSRSSVLPRVGGWLRPKSADDQPEPASAPGAETPGAEANTATDPTSATDERGG